MNLINKFKNAPGSVQGMIILGIVLIIGIIIRWNYIMEHIIKGFKYYSGE
jgi:uncharacterized membrane protein